MTHLEQTIRAVILRGDARGYVAECVDFALVTLGRMLDKTVQILREATALHLDGQHLTTLGLRDN